MNEYVQEVEHALYREAKHVPPGRAAICKHYMGSRFDFLGMTVPAQRQLFAKGYSFTNLPPKKQLPIWSYIWRYSQCYEAMTQAVMFAERFKRDPGHAKDLWPGLKSWVSRVDNWGHADGLCGVYAATLECNHPLVFPQLKQWNRSRHAWLRRMSIVSLLYYSNSRSKILPFKKMIPLVERLLSDEDIYVQKGVGWTLRELGNVYPKDTQQFIRKHILTLSPAAFTSATEKWSLAAKMPLKAARKNHRRRARK